MLLPELWWGQGSLEEGPSADHALGRIESIPVAEQGEGDKHAVRFVLEAVDGGDIPADDAVAYLCIAAHTLDDAQAWRETIQRATSNPFDRSLHLDVVAEAITAFGLDVVLPRYAPVLR